MIGKSNKNNFIDSLRLSAFWVSSRHIHGFEGCAVAAAPAFQPLHHTSHELRR